MGLKTFNLDEETYKKYSSHCRENGISMSKRVEGFIRQELDKIDGKQANQNMASKQSIQPSESKQDIKHTMQRYC